MRMLSPLRGKGVRTSDRILPALWMIAHAGNELELSNTGAESREEISI